MQAVKEQVVAVVELEIELLVMVVVLEQLE
jgi:hypothetical protein